MEDLPTSGIQGIATIHAGAIKIEGHPTLACTGPLPIFKVPEVPPEVQNISSQDVSAVVEDVATWLYNFKMIPDLELARKIALDDYFNFCIHVFPDMVLHGHETMTVYTCWMGFIWSMDDLIEEQFVPSEKTKTGEKSPLDDLAGAFERMWYADDISEKLAQIEIDDNNNKVVPKMEAILKGFQDLVTSTQRVVPDAKDFPHFIDCMVTYVKHLSWYSTNGMISL